MIKSTLKIHFDDSIKIFPLIGIENIIEKIKLHNFEEYEVYKINPSKTDSKDYLDVNTGVIITQPYKGRIRAFDADSSFILDEKYLNDEYLTKLDIKAWFKF